MSAAYYALFHKLVDEATSRLVGTAYDRSDLRRSLGRGFPHAGMRDACAGFRNAFRKNDPVRRVGLGAGAIQTELSKVAAAFVDLQQARHEADYDTARRFTKQEALEHVRRAKDAFQDWSVVRRSLPADSFLVALLAWSQLRSS